jgi:adenosylcobinamide-GDP ribazoletransferase
MHDLATDLIAALRLLTRLPVGWLAGADRPPNLRRMVWAYPLVGALVGAIGGGAYWIAAGIGCPPALAAVWCIAALVLVTGALHEDGLADTADGFGGGATAERKLEIMRDSRSGSYGVIAMVLSLALRIAVVALLATPGAVIAALIIAGALGRGVCIGLLFMPAARSDGLAAQSGSPDPTAAGAGFTLAALLALLLLPTGAALVAMLAAGVAGLAVAWLARRQIGGQTGDVLGAGEQMAECLVLTALVAVA